MEVGQTVYLETCGNLARRGVEIIEGRIAKIGRKYFDVEGYGTFHIDSMVQKTEYSPNYKVYFTKQEIEDKNERSELNSKIYDLFRYGGSKLTLQQLREIDKIIKHNC